VNAQGGIPLLRIKLAMLFLNLAVWTDAAIRVVG